MRRWVIPRLIDALHPFGVDMLQVEDAVYALQQAGIDMGYTYQPSKGRLVCLQLWSDLWQMQRDGLIDGRWRCVDGVWRYYCWRVT